MTYNTFMASWLKGRNRLKELEDRYAPTISKTDKALEIEENPKYAPKSTVPDFSKHNIGKPQRFNFQSWLKSKSVESDVVSEARQLNMSPEEIAEIQAIQQGTTVKPSMQIPQSLAETSQSYVQELRTIPAEEAIKKIQSIETLPKETWKESAQRNVKDWGQFIPFASSAIDYFKLSTANNAAQAIMEGKPVSEKELEQLYEFVYKSSVDKSFGANVVDILAKMPSYAGEIAATGGIYKGVQAGTTSALKKLIGDAVSNRLVNLAVRGIAGAAGAGIAGIPAAAIRTPAGTMERQTFATLTGQEESLLESTRKAFGTAWVEAASERTGGAFDTLTAPLKNQLMKIGLFKAVQKLNPLKSNAQINKLFQTFGYNGILGEMFEERVADIGHAMLGTEPFKLPSGEQLLTELVAFSIPSGAGRAVNTTASLTNKILQMANEIEPMPAHELNEELPDDIQMPPSTSVQPGLEGFGVQPQSEMFGEVSGRESRIEPLTQVPQRQEILPEQRAMELEGRRYEIESDPLANYKVTLSSGKKVNIDNLIDAKEKTFAYNDSFTPAQAKAIKPNVTFSESQKLANGRIRADAVLDELADKYAGGDVSALIDRVNQIREMKTGVRDMKVTTPAESVPEVTPAVTTPEVTSVVESTKPVEMSRPDYTIEQIDALAGVFGDYLENPTVLNAWKLTQELRTSDRANRASNLSSRIEQLISQNVDTEQAIKQAIKDTLSGELPSMTTDYWKDIGDELRQALFDKVYYELKNEPYELASTVTALTNALNGNPIPREPGTKGGSAYSRLQRVFGSNPKLLKGIEKAASEKKPIDKIVEGIFKEIPEGGLQPIPVDQNMFDYLSKLSNEFDQIKLGESDKLLTLNMLEHMDNLPSNLTVKDVRSIREKLIDMRKKGLLKIEDIDQEMFDYLSKLTNSFDQVRLGQVGNMLNLELLENLRDLPTDITIEDARSFVEKLIDMRKKGLLPYEPVVWYDQPTNDVIKQYPLIPKDVSDKIIDILKEIVYAPSDIFGGLRSILASIDQSFALRQLLFLLPNIRGEMLHIMVDSWKSGWSPEYANEIRKQITRDPLYQMYEKGVDEGHGNPLRLSNVFEFGYRRESDRVIHKVFDMNPVSNWSERNYVTGINRGVWFYLHKEYEYLLRKAEKIASGEMKAPKNGFSIEREFFQQMDYLANMTGKANLGKVSDNVIMKMANNMLFSLPFKVGRFLTPIHLIGLNKFGKDATFSSRVMHNAWRDLGTVISVIGALIGLGVLAGWWKTETDIRSTDFGKIKIGNTRIDPWGGLQQVVVFLAQVISKQSKSSRTDEMYDTDLVNSVANMIRKSGSPFLSFILESYSGKTYTGEEVDYQNAHQWVDRLAPFVVQDVLDTLEQDGDIAKAVASGVLGYLGAGVSTYGTTYEDVAGEQTKLGKDDREKRYTDLANATTPAERENVKNKDYTYTLQNFGAYLNENTKNYNSYDEYPPIVYAYWKDRDLIDEYNASVNKEDLRKNNYRIDAALILWRGYRSFVNPQTKKYIEQFADKYRISLDTIPIFTK